MCFRTHPGYIHIFSAYHTLGWQNFSLGIVSFCERNSSVSFDWWSTQCREQAMETSENCFRRISWTEGGGGGVELQWWNVDNRCRKCLPCVVLEHITVPCHPLRHLPRWYDHHSFSQKKKMIERSWPQPNNRIIAWVIDRTTPFCSFHKQHWPNYQNMQAYSLLIFSFIWIMPLTCSYTFRISTSVTFATWHNKL